jgi:hypothetical protein
MSGELPPGLPAKKAALMGYIPTGDGGVWTSENPPLLQVER